MFLLSRSLRFAFGVSLSIFFFAVANVEAQNQTPKFCMHCKGIKTTYAPEGTPYACKYCNGTGILPAKAEQDVK